MSAAVAQQRLPSPATAEASEDDLDSGLDGVPYSPIDANGGGQASSSTLASPTNAEGSTPVAREGEATAPVKKKKVKKRKKIVNVNFTKYNLIREVANDLGFHLDKEDEESVDRLDYNLIWSDTVLPMQRVMRLSNWQRTNHFPSMSVITRKVHLGLTLGRMRKLFPAYYNFFPRTFSLRSERSQFSKYLTTAGARKTFILKPNAGCQGKGIVLTRDPLNAVEDLEHYVVQEYIAKPLLIEGKKFDLRVYAFVSSVRHLSIHVFDDGLVRLCAENYSKPTEENLGVSCMHLTNYAVNKHHEDFEFNTDADKTDVGSKRDFRFLNAWLAQEGHSVEKFWDRIDHLISKTLIAAQPQLSHVYNSCFPHNNDGLTCCEILGFDVMIDEKMKPWLLEVNHTPSLATDTPLDHRIKHSLVSEAWRIINIQASDRQKHIDREKTEFARRINSKGAASMTSDNSGANGNGTAAQPAAEPEPFSPTAWLADQDTRIQHFRRIYPPRDPERQILYDTMFGAAKEAAAVQTTASQEQRLQEAKQEREKREAAKKLDKSKQAGGASPITQNAQSSYPPSSVGDEVRQGTPPQGTRMSARSSSTTRPTNPRKNSITSSNGSNATSSNQMPTQPGARKPPKEEQERLRRRLNEQMERHRRRMVLGPRLSVFQLRDAQVAAMLAEEMAQQGGLPNQQSTDPSGQGTSLLGMGPLSGLSGQDEQPHVQGITYAQSSGGYTGPVLTSSPVGPQPAPGYQRSNSLSNPGQVPVSLHPGPAGDVLTYNQVVAAGHSRALAGDTNRIPLFDLAYMSIDTGEGFDEEEEE